MMKPVVLAKDHPLNDRVINLLRSGPMDISQIEIELEIHDGSLPVALQEFEKEGFINSYFERPEDKKLAEAQPEIYGDRRVYRLNSPLRIVEDFLAEHFFRSKKYV